MATKTTTIVLGALLAVAAAGARADEVSIGGLPYPNVVVTDVQNCEVTFKTASGTLVSKPLAEAGRIQLRGRDEFNAAEDLLGNGKFAEAADAYRKLPAAAQIAWMDRLIRFRLLRALEGAGKIHDATTEWLVIVDENKASAASLSLRPKKLPVKGTPDNARTIDLLKVKAERVKDSAYRTAIDQFLLALLRQEGRDEEAVALAGAMSGKPSVAAPASGPADAGTSSASPPGPAPEPAGGNPEARLQAAKVLLEAGNAQRVIDDLDLNAFSDDKLPTALMLVGQAQWQLAEKAGEGEQRKKLLCEAGLNFMRVAALLSSTAEAPEAMYQAARVSAALGNAPAAARAYRMVIEKYAKSPAAEKARAALKGG